MVLLGCGRFAALPPTYTCHVGWGKTRGQRAPHPNTSNPHDRQKPNQFARYGYFQSHTRKQSWHPVGWISLSASTASASLSRWWRRKLIHPTKAPIVGWGKKIGRASCRERV